MPPLNARAALLTALLLPLPAAAALDQAQADSAFNYLNSLRLLAGMGPLGGDAQLEIAAEGHASYLETNNLGGGHGQNSAHPGFTGGDASTRAVAAGYSSTTVSENVSGGQSDANESVDGLMGAIYHRFGFLDFSIDQIGIGITNDGSYARYVYNMGNAGLQAACSGSPFSGSGSFYTACANNGRISASAYEGARGAVRDANPAWVVWPSDGNGDTPPAFFEESPDPLPDYSVSGYPVSLNFNEAKVGAVQLLDLTVRSAADGTPITNTRLLDQSSDPNGRFSDKEFALFPLDRLAWDTRYRADADLLVDGRRTFLRWEFQTRDLGMEVFTLNGDGESLSVGSGSRFALYFPPASASDTLGSLRWSFSGGTEVDASYLDSNTLGITISGGVGGRADFTVGSRSFSLAIDGSTPLAATGGNSHEAGCVGGVTLAHYDPADGVLTVPAVEVGGSVYAATLQQQAGGGEFTLATLQVGEGAAGEVACAAAAFDFASGVLDIPVVMVASGSAAATAYRAQLTLQSDPSATRFALTSAQPE